MSPVDAVSKFTFDGTNLLYAEIQRVSIEELRLLLARGSGYVVRGGQRQKTWFQAQCAHYGLPTQGTLAAVRHQLDKFLAHSTARVPEQIVLLEKKKREEYNSTPTTAVPLSDVPYMKDQILNSRQERVLFDLPDARNSTEPCTAAPPAPETQPENPLVHKINHKPTPTVTRPPKSRNIPRAKLAAVVQFTKSGSELHALQRIKLMVGRPKPTSETETESDDDSDSSTHPDMRTAAVTSYGYRSYIWQPPRNLVSFTQDVVSGQWELSATYHTTLPLPAPWRPASSKWLQGDMNACLSGDGRSLSGEFALLGMDGVFKSRKCELRKDGICSWVRFVAQKPITTANPSREWGGRNHNIVFGPSETQYGYLRFHGSGKVVGMLKCRDYGRIEFTGVRVGGPLDMVSSWRNFVE